MTRQRQIIVKYSPCLPPFLHKIFPLAFKGKKKTAEKEQAPSWSNHTEFEISHGTGLLRSTAATSTHSPLWGSLTSSLMQLRRAGKEAYFRAVWWTFAMLCCSCTAIRHALHTRLCLNRVQQSAFLLTSSAHTQTAYWNLKGGQLLQQYSDFLYVLSR